MSAINSYTLLVGILAAIAAVGFAGMLAVQAVYAQGTTTPTQDLTALLTTITGIITTVSALAGGIIASYARMSQKLGIARDDQIEKMLTVAKELQNTDHWGRELEERLVAIGDVIAELPGGKEMLEQKRVDLKRWNEEAAKLNGEISGIYDVLIPLLAKKK
jgi:hypothetical protein